eukprot:m.357512 g.357512  ORF g.357512 m.357512 type:complete len:89 (+) comp17858_c0_seq1:233-499(+)
MGDCVEQAKNGFALGAGLGVSAGAVFSIINSYSMGLTKRTFLRRTALSMVGFGGVFGLFVAVKGAITCEMADQHHQQQQQSSPQPALQ